MPSCRSWSTRCWTRPLTIRAWSMSIPISSSTRRSSKWTSTATRLRRSGVEVETIGTHARDPARRTPGHPLQARGRAVRRDREGRRHRPPQPRRFAPHLCARARRHHDPAVQPDERQRSVAPKELNHFNQLRSAMITSHLAPGYTLSEGLDYLEKAAEEVLPPTRPHRLCRAVARVQADELEHLFHLPARACLHLSRARRAVRELQGSLHHHAHRAALDHRRAARAVVERGHAQHL